jgi:hypothetical protein
MTHEAAGGRRLRVATAGRHSPTRVRPSAVASPLSRPAARRLTRVSSADRLRLSSSRTSDSLAPASITRLIACGRSLRGPLLIANTLDGAKEEERHA